jgi:hypothetical protein
VTIRGGGIADWWSTNPEGDVRSRQIIPVIDFSFGGELTITAGDGTSLEAILGSGPVQMDISLGGRFASGPVVIARPAVPAPLPLAGLAAAYGWCRVLRRRSNAPR